MSDGLANTRVTCLHLDRRGFLWAGTWEGMSRFDGAEFSNYGVEQGLPNPVVNTIAEDANGTLWIATNGGGLARLASEPDLEHPDRPVFLPVPIGTSVRSNLIVSVAFDPAGALWCGTHDGIYRCADPRAPVPRFDCVVPGRRLDWRRAMYVDPGGALWCGFADELARIDGGNVISMPLPRERIGQLVVLMPGAAPQSLLVAFERALFTFDTATCDWCAVPIELPPQARIRDLLRDTSGTLWVATNQGLIRARAGRQTLFTTAQRLSDSAISSLVEDRDQNLWIGTWSGGLCKYAGDAFVSYTMQDGMPGRVVTRIVESGLGSIVACTFTGLAEIRDGRVRVVPGSQAPPFDRLEIGILQDQRGDWWLGTTEGLFRFDGPDLQLEHGTHLGPEHGLPQGPIAGAIHEDARGVIWVATREPRLYHYDPHGSVRVQFTGRDLPELAGEPPRVYLLSPSGRLWIAPIRGLWRLWGDALARVELGGAAGDDQVRCLYRDRRGALWIGTRYQGVLESDAWDPEPASFTRYSTQSGGLASNACWAIAEDDAGRLYFGSSRGVDRLDVATRKITHYSSGDGLAGEIVTDALCDRDGDLWFATSGGLTRFDPRVVAPPVAAPPIYLTRIQLGGEDLPLPEVGTQHAPAVELPAHRNSVSIDYVGVSFRGEQQLAYQYRLEGSDRDWCQPTRQRSVHYARLAPGSYAFEVRAMHAAGVASVEPATFHFRILPPIYARWWFLALAGGLACGAILLWHRQRVLRLVALESIRRQIATDIHDDLGSGLSQIAILAEVVRRDPSSASLPYLEQVAELARSLRDSMSDIVWSIDPRKDRFSDLVQRMRQVAFNLTQLDELEVEFRAPAAAALDRIELSPDRRRHIFLIFKEALTNAARHAHASRVTIEAAIENGTLRLTVRDDGRGFDPDQPGEGQGLQSLRRRAALLEGRLAIESGPGSGTTLTLEVPIRTQRARSGSSSND